MTSLTTLKASIQVLQILNVYIKKKGTDAQENTWGEVWSVYSTELYTWTAAKLAAGIQT